MTGRERQMTMEQAITFLRASGWRVDVDEATKNIFLREPCPNANWLHVLRTASDCEGRSVAEHSCEDGQQR